MTSKFSVRTLDNSQCTNATNQILTEALPSAGVLLLQIYEEVFVTDHQLNPISFPPENSILTMIIAYTNLQESVIQRSQSICSCKVKNKFYKFNTCISLI